MSKTVYVTVDPNKVDIKDETVRRTIRKSLSVDLDKKKTKRGPPRRRGVKKSKSSDQAVFPRDILEQNIRRAERAERTRKRQSLKLLSSDTAELLPADFDFEVPWHEVVDADECERKALHRKKGSEKEEKNKANDKNVKKKKKKDPHRETKIAFFKLLNFRHPDKKEGDGGGAAAAAEYDLDVDTVADMLDKLPRLAKDKYLFTAFTEPITALHMLCVINAPISLIKKCYKLNPNALSDASSTLGSPLHYACWYHANLKSIRYLVSQDVSILLICNRAKRTPLHLACIRSTATADLVVLLTDACPEAAQLVDHDGLTPLHLALQAETPLLGIVEDLTEVYPAAVALPAPETESTPLHMAAANNNVGLDILKDLILSCPKALKKIDAQEQTPLHLAVASKCGYKEIKVLVKKYPKAALMENQIGETPIQIAKFLRLEESILNLLSPYV